MCGGPREIVGVPEIGRGPRGFWESQGVPQVPWDPASLGGPGSPGESRGSQRLPEILGSQDWVPLFHHVVFKPFTFTAKTNTSAKIGPKMELLFWYSYRYVNVTIQFQCFKNTHIGKD